MLDYLARQYRPGNAVLAIAGDIRPPEVAESVRREVAGWQRGKQRIDYPPYRDKIARRVLIEKRDTEQTQLCLGVPGYHHQHKKLPALNLLSIVLGGNMSSRLFISVRERNGLAYYVHTSVDATTDTGYLVTQAGIKNDSLEKAVELVLSEYKDLRDKKITAKELKKAKDYLRGTMALSLDATDAQASFFAMQEVTEQNILTPEEKLKIIDKVTVSDINKIAKDIFSPEKLNLAVIGPIEEKESDKLKQILKL